jgi:hypothetical protein
VDSSERYLTGGKVDWKVRKGVCHCVSVDESIVDIDGTLREGLREIAVDELK